MLRRSRNPAGLKIPVLGQVTRAESIKIAKRQSRIRNLVAGLLRFDDKPLKYKVLDKAYLIYSISPDGRDDAGGKRWGRDKKAQRLVGDLTFTVTTGPRGE